MRIDISIDEHAEAVGRFLCDGYDRCELCIIYDKCSASTDWKAKRTPEDLRLLAREFFNRGDDDGYAGT